MLSAQFEKLIYNATSFHRKEKKKKIAWNELWGEKNQVYILWLALNVHMKKYSRQWYRSVLIHKHTHFFSGWPLKVPELQNSGMNCANTIFNYYFFIDRNYSQY